MKTCPVCDTPFPDQHFTCPTDGAVLIESRELAPGHIVKGKYRIVRKLGQGGMGIVYLADYLLLGRQVALKFLARELGRDSQFVKRFLNEARAAYQLRHANVVEVTGLDQDEEGSLFIEMEYVAGPSLRLALREAKGPLPVARALQIARDVAAGLAAAHARGAVHRDIKPENILLGTGQDGREQAKVADFGLAVMADSITNLTRTNMLMLTPEYAAPEQWRGTPASQLDDRTDLYALGGVLYEMLAGRTPFRAVNQEGWMFQHLQGTPDPLTRLRPELARGYPWLEPVVMRLLAREREKRFSSAEALQEALNPGHRAATTAPPVPPPLPPVMEARIVIEPAIESVPRLTPDRRTPPGTIEPPAPPPRRKPILKWALLAAVLIVAGLGAWLAIKFLRPAPATAVPMLSPAGGTYPEARPVTISDDTPQATIHYTLDGSMPTEASPVYTQPLEALPSGTVVRAMATAEDHTPSSDITGAYFWSGGPRPEPIQPKRSAYDQGKDAYDQKQYDKARTLFTQSCDGGELKACNYLGYLYAQGLGGPSNTQKAREFYGDACDRGNLSSCASLGSLYQNAGDSGAARKYFKKACDGGLAEGCNLLHGAQ